MVPGDSVTIDPNEPELVDRLLKELVIAEEQPTDQEKLNYLNQIMKKMPLDTMGYGSETELQNSYIVDLSSGTIIPKLSSIIDIESYERGANQGETKTHFGTIYLKMLRATLEASKAQPGMYYKSVAEARDTLYNRVATAYGVGTQRNKNIGITI